MIEQARRSTDAVMNVLNRARTLDYIGEDISQINHALQCAHFGNIISHGDPEFILACLLHDVGHFCMQGPVESMGDFGIADHEAIGARYLQQLGFNNTVVELVRGHVLAKRFLVSTSEKYRSKLSKASLETLRYQGGELSEEEKASFAANPLSKAMIQLRRCDEMAKEKNLNVKPLEFYEPMIFTALLTPHYLIARF